MYTPVNPCFPIYIKVECKGYKLHGRVIMMDEHADSNTA